MQIYKIAVYDLNSQRLLYSAADANPGSTYLARGLETFIPKKLNATMLELGTVTKSMAKLSPFSRSVKRVFDEGDVFNAFLAANDKSNRVAVIVTDEDITLIDAYHVAQKIELANSNDELERLIRDPQNAIKSKETLVREKIIASAEDAIREVYKKRIEFGEALEQTMEQTAEMEALAVVFSKSATKLKQDMQGCNLNPFSFFKRIGNYIYDNTFISRVDLSRNRKV